MAKNLEAVLRLRDEFTKSLERVDSQLQKTTKSMDKMKSVIDRQKNMFDSLASAAQSSISKMNSVVRSSFNAMTNTVKTSIERILKTMGNFGNRIKSVFNLGPLLNNVSNTFSKIASTIKSKFSGIASTVKGFGSKIASALKLDVAFKGITSGIRGALSKAGSMISGFSQSVSSKFGNIGRNIGSSFSKLKSTFGNFGNDMRNAFSNVSNGANSAHNSILELASAFGVLKLAGAAVGLIGKNLDAAIGRFDTLQRFPKIMDMWGYSSDVVSKAQTKMVDGIEGLPTTLQDITGNVQAMTSITGDLGKATDVSLALNNAFLASGASTADASRGLQQFSQMLSVGKVDMMAWRTLQETMPGALSQTAKAFGFAGSSATTDFYDALDNGDISMTQFQDKLIELSNETGGFADQAKVASAGIKTSFQNLANTMSKGLANSITAIDDWAKSNSFGTIAENIDGMKGIINDAFSSINESIPKFLDKLLPYLQIMQQAFEKVKEPIKTAINSIRKSLDAISGDKFGSKGSLNSFQGFVDGLVEGIEKLADFANKHSDTIAKVIDIFGKLVGAFIGFNLGAAVVGTPFKILGIMFKPLTGFLSTGWAIAKGIGKLGLGIGGAIAALFGGGKGAKNLGKNALPTISAKDSGLNFLNSLSKTASQFAKGAKNIALIYGVIKLIEELAEAMKQVNDKVPADLTSLAPKLGNMAIALTGMGAFVGVAGAIAKNNFGNAVKGLAVIAGLSGNIMLAAEAMKEVSDKVPDNIATFSSKLANMAIAISGMGVLVAVAGQLTTMNPIGAVAGLAVVALISGELMLASEAMKQVNDKVPDNIGSFASKVANIAIGIGGMFALVQIVGTLAALNPIGTIAGLATVTLIAGELILVAEAMKQVNEKVPDDVGNFKNKINNMASAINAFNETDFGGIVEIVQNALAGLNFAVITGAIDKMIGLANKLNQLNEIEVSADVSTKINQIESAISALDMSSLTDVIASLTTTIDLTVLNTAIDRLIEIASKLAELNVVEVNADTAKTKIGGIMNVLTALDGATLVELIGATLEASQLEKAVSSINSMVSMASPINTLASSEINAESATANITKIQSVVDTLKQSILSGIFTEITGADELGNALQSIQAMQSLVSPINGMANSEINAELANANIDKVKNVFNKLRRGFLQEIFTDLITADELSQALQSIQGMQRLVTPINGMANSTVNSELALTVIENIKSVLSALSQNIFGAWITELISQDELANAKLSIHGMQSLVTPINGLANSTVNSELAVTVIGNIKSVLNAINGITITTSEDTVARLETVKIAISKLQEVGNAVNAFSQGVFDFAGALNQINQIKNIITQLNMLPASTGVAGLQGLISTFNQLTTAINSFSTQSAVSINGLISAFSRLGSSSNMMASITVQAVTRMTVAFQSGMTSIRAIVTSGMSAISSSAVSGMARFNSAISGGISRAAATARSGSSQISSAFNALNGQLYSAGLFAMSGLTSGISSGAGRAIAAARSVANSVSSTIRTALKIHSPSRVMVSIGEYITQGLAKGIMASSKLVDKASGRLADMATPQVEMAGITANLPTEMTGATRVINEILNPADMSEVSSYDNGISMDQSDIDDMHAVLDRKVIVENKQVVPQVTVVVNDNEGGADPEAIARQVEEILVKAMDEDMS